MVRSSKTSFFKPKSNKKSSRSTTGRSAASKTAKTRAKAPTKKTANKRSTRRKPRSGDKQPISPFRTFLVASTLGALSAFGFWRCFDGSDTSPLDPYEPRLSQAAVQEVDVGKGKQVDPTLINEKQLLEEEMPPTMEPEREPEQKPALKPAKGEESEDADTQIDTSKRQDSAEEAPPEKTFPMHGVAFHFHTQVRDEPSDDGHVIGYFRRGTQFRVSQRLSTKGCDRGWYEVSPGGYYVCNGVGTIISDEPVTFAPSPVQPNLDNPLPYEYRFVSQNDTPQYWRIPTPQEVTEVTLLFDRLSQGDQDEQLDKRGLEEVLQKAAELGQVAEAPAPSPALLDQDGGADTDTDTDTEDSDAFPAYLHLRMARGFYVSIDDLVQSEAGDFRRTVRGRFIPEDRLAKAQPSSFEGILLTGEKDRSLPLAFVVGGGVKLLRQNEQDGPLENDRRVERHDVLPVLGTMTRKHRHYVQVDEGLYLSDRVAAVAELSPPPADLEEHERWIDVDLSEQTLVAYEGAEPVFATIISSGRKEYETPTGNFRIYGKHVSITMDDTAAGEESYSIEDVPWTQYFQDGYALHTAFWHNRFGRVRSHGCINLSPLDAHRLFNWTGPKLEGGLHGVVATKNNEGTRVVIHE